MSDAGEALDLAPADVRVDGVGGGVVRDGDHARERRAHRVAHGPVLTQVGHEQHRLDDARGDERTPLVVAVEVAAAVHHGHGDVAGATRRPGEGRAPGTGGGDQRRQRRKDAKRCAAGARLGAAARVEGVGDEPVAAAAQPQAAAPRALDADGRHAACDQAPADVAGEGGHEQLDGHVAAGGVVGAIADLGPRSAVDRHVAHDGGRQGVAHERRGGGRGGWRWGRGRGGRGRGARLRRGGDHDGDAGGAERPRRPRRRRRRAATTRPVRLLRSHPHPTPPDPTGVPAAALRARGGGQLPLSLAPSGS